MIEVEAVLEQHNNAYRNSWEQTRFAAFINARVQGAKVNKPADIITFAWEKTEVPESRKLTPDELRKLTADMTESFDRYKKGDVTEWKPE